MSQLMGRGDLSAASLFRGTAERSVEGVIGGQAGMRQGEKEVGEGRMGMIIAQYQQTLVKLQGLGIGGNPTVGMELTEGYM